MKELNLIEVMDMPVESEFEVRFNDGFVFDTGNKVKIVNCNDGRKLIWSATNNDVICGSWFVDAKFIQLKKQVSFMEVVSSDSKCSVEFDNCIPTRYESLRDIILILIDSYGELGLKKAIKMGKWYLED